MSVKHEVRNLVESVVDVYSNKISTSVDKNMKVAKVLALTMEELAVPEGAKPSREEANDILESILKVNTQLVGISICFEPDKYDGRENQFINAPYHDEKGYFISYMCQDGGEDV